MDCQKITKKISAYFDDELSTNEKKQIEKHIQTCDDCKELYEQFATLEQSIKDQLQPHIPPQWIATKLYAAIEADKKQRSRFQKFWKSFQIQPDWLQGLEIASATAALIFLFSLLSHYFTFNGPNQIKTPAIPLIAEEPSDAKLHLCSAIRDFFAKSDQIILNVQNSQNISYLPEEQVQADKLLQTRHLLAKRVKNTNYENLLPVINEMEPILYDIANMKSNESLQQVQKLISLNHISLTLNESLRAHFK